MFPDAAGGFGAEDGKVEAVWVLTFRGIPERSGPGATLDRGSEDKVPATIDDPVNPSQVTLAIGELGYPK